MDGGVFRERGVGVGCVANGSGEESGMDELPLPDPESSGTRMTNHPDTFSLPMGGRGVGIVSV